MSNRLSKDQLETDALVTSYYTFTQWVKENRMTVIGGALAFFLILGGFIWYTLDSAEKERTARDLITYSEAQFLRGNYENALYGDDERMKPGLVEIANRFSRTSAGNIAKYYAAISYSRLGEYESALSYIRDYDVPDGVIGVGPVSLHATILLNLGRYSDAVRMFERAAEWDINDATTPFNLLQAAEAAIEDGNHSRARSLTQRIIDEYPDSSVAPNAKRLNGRLSVTAN